MARTKSVATTLIIYRTYELSVEGPNCWGAQFFGGAISWGPNFWGAQFWGAQFFGGPNFLGAQFWGAQFFAAAGGRGRPRNGEKQGENCPKKQKNTQKNKKGPQIKKWSYLGLESTKSANSWTVLHNFSRFVRIWPQNRLKPIFSTSKSTFSRQFCFFHELPTDCYFSFFGAPFSFF